MKFAYIGGPYRAKHAYQIDRNIRKAKEVGEELALMGYFPIIPHLNTAHMDGIQDDAFWLNGTLELLRKTGDLLVLLPEWPNSSGSCKERYVAIQELNLPIFYWPRDIEELMQFVNET